MTKVLRAVLGHRMDGPAITYRVQWTNEICEWIPGTEIDSEENQDILLAYWKNSDNQFKEQGCQTNPCYSVDFSHIADMVCKDITDFVAFRPTGWEQVTDVTIPAEILHIDYTNEKILVKYSRDTEPVEIPLETVKNTAPLLLAEYLLKGNH